MVRVRGKLMLFIIIEKSKVSSTNLCDKLQLVNSVKRFVFDLRIRYSIDNTKFWPHINLDR